MLMVAETFGGWGLMGQAAEVAGYDFGPLCKKIADLSLTHRS